MRKIPDEFERLVPMKTIPYRLPWENITKAPGTVSEAHRRKNPVFQYTKDNLHPLLAADEAFVQHGSLPISANTH